MFHGQILEQGPQQIQKAQPVLKVLVAAWFADMCRSYQRKCSLWFIESQLNKPPTLKFDSKVGHQLWMNEHSLNLFLTPCRPHFSLFIFIPSSLLRMMSRAIISASWAGGPFIQIRGSLLRDTRSRWAFWFDCLAESVRTGRVCHSAVMMIKGAPWIASFLPYSSTLPKPPYS